MSKYEIDTKENREFVKCLREDLLSFGHGFASQKVAHITWAMTVRRGATDHARHG